MGRRCDAVQATIPVDTDFKNQRSLFFPHTPSTGTIRTLWLKRFETSARMWLHACADGLLGEL